MFLIGSKLRRPCERRRGPGPRKPASASSGSAPPGRADKASLRSQTGIANPLRYFRVHRNRGHTKAAARFLVPAERQRYPKTHNRVVTFSLYDRLLKVNTVVREGNV